MGDDSSEPRNSSGVPLKTILPPFLPPPGPNSMIQSAADMMSKLCSMTTTVLSWSMSLRRWLVSIEQSEMCRPVEGSSRI